MKVVKHYTCQDSPGTYVFTLSDGNARTYKREPSGLVGKMSENSEAQYKAVQRYASENLGDLSVQLSIFS